jgi:hypothetical protein
MGILYARKGIRKRTKDAEMKLLFAFMPAVTSSPGPFPTEWGRGAERQEIWQVNHHSFYLISI